MSTTGRAAWLAKGGAKKTAKPTRPALSIGVVWSVPGGAAERPETTDAYVDAMLSTAWQQPLRYLISQSIGGRPHPRRAGMLPSAQRADVLRELLVHPDLREVTLATSEKDVGAYETLSAETRTRSPSGRASVHGRSPLADDGAPIADAWVEGMLTLAARVGADHGVVSVMNELAVAAEGSLTTFRVDGKVQHPFPDELARMAAAADQLGATYIRFPRWGTLLSNRHLDMLGGLERIRDAVRPARTRELGDAVYFQLTDSVATATTPAALEQQAAFTRLAAPLLPPG